MLWGGGITALVLAPIVFLAGYFVFIGDTVSDIGGFGEDPGGSVAGSPGLWIMIGSIGLGIAGIVVAIVGYVRDADPMDAAGKKSLADKYNSGQARADDPDDIDFLASPVITPTYQGFALGLSF